MTDRAPQTLPLMLLTIAVLFGDSVSPAEARARGVGEIVMAVCMSAFENEMAQAGKRPPAGMASYACSCVVDQISNGSSIDAARSSCRSATARRYPI